MNDATTMRLRIEELEAEIREYKRLLFCPPIGMGVKLGLDNRKSQILEAIVRAHPGAVPKTRLEFLWDCSADAGNCVAVNIHYLRKRLRPIGIDIKTERGRGYFIDTANKARLDTLLEQFGKEVA